MSGKGRDLAERRWLGELAERRWVVFKRGESRYIKRQASRARRRFAAAEIRRAAP